jgi:hypothetical protein
LWRPECAATNRCQFEGTFRSACSPVRVIQADRELIIVNADVHFSEIRLRNVAPRVIPIHRVETGQLRAGA